MGHAVTAHVEQAVRHSYIYDWLTREPELIVIDLWDTRTVGPSLRLLEAVIRPLKTAWLDSRLKSVTAATNERVRQLPGYDLAVAILDLPAPAERETGPDEPRE